MEENHILKKNYPFVILIKIMVVMYMQKKLYLNLKNFFKLMITKMNVYLLGISKNYVT